MSLHLPGAVKAYITKELIQAAAAFTSEKEEGIRKATEGALLSMLAGIIVKAASFSEQAKIIELAKEASATHLLKNPVILFETGKTPSLDYGASLLKAVMGDRTTGISHLVGGYAGIKTSSAITLLSMLAPVALATIGKYATDNKLKDYELGQQLRNQQSAILNALPAGIGPIAGMLGLSRQDASGGSTNGEDSTSRDGLIQNKVEVEEESRVLKLLLPIFLGILLLVLSVYFFKGWRFDNKFDTITARDSTRLYQENRTVKYSILPSTIYSGPPMVMLELPNGTVMKVYKDKMEDKLVNFIESDYTGLGKDSLKKIWFDFENLAFNHGSGELSYPAQQELVNLVAILKAFPTVRIKIGGYTDKTGNETENVKLSGLRAASIQSVLVNARLGKQINGAEGYGSSMAKFPADASDNERAKDRRVAVSVRM